MSNKGYVHTHAKSNMRVEKRVDAVRPNLEILRFYI
eukprot:SAG11_NODE_69_length_18453_cov_37.601613_11_plen_36_part_00